MLAQNLRQEISRVCQPGSTILVLDDSCPTRFITCFLTEAPQHLLQEVAKACKPGGKILLLEHGRSSYDWLNRILDDGAGRHKKRWACRWNLDIADVVKQAGLHVESMSRWHFGTTYVIIATPR